QLVLIVIELYSHGPPLHRKGKARQPRGSGRIRITGLKRKLLARDLRNQQSLERGIGRKRDHRRICKLVAAGEIKQMRHTCSHVKVDATRASASQVLTLTPDESGRDAERHIS